MRTYHIQETSKTGFAESLHTVKANNLQQAKLKVRLKNFIASPVIGYLNCLKIANSMKYEEVKAMLIV